MKSDAERASAERVWMNVEVRVKSFVDVAMVSRISERSAKLS
jgi:hypothetical protein